MIRGRDVLKDGIVRGRDGSKDGNNKREKCTCVLMSKLLH